MSVLKGQSILITGGTGSFGRKCVEILLRDYAPRRLVVFSRDEQKHVDMMRHQFSPDRYPQLRYFVGDVRDLGRLRRALQGVDFVIHAAAMKHVDLAEYNPQECIRTNVNGSENVINACLDAGVKQAVALSTDKAANPINLYGATKLCADKLFVAANALGGKDGTRFSVVRYGNVVGSKGSVVPLFLEQRKNGVLTLTDPRMTRFWITLEKAVHMVVRAFDMMFGGELFVPKIPSMKLVDLARAIGPDCRTEIVGIRPGEKLHEVLITRDDARTTVELDDCYVIEPALRWWAGDTSLLQRGGQPVAEDMRYSSDLNSCWLTVDQLREMIRPFEPETVRAGA